MTPGVKLNRPVPRISATNEDLTAVSNIDIHYYSKPIDGMVSLTYRELPTITYKDPTWKLDLLWKVAWPIRSPMPGRSGMMQAINQGNHPGKSSVTLLQMIDMDPSNMSCVYSTLKYVSSEARRHDVTPILTFDQPLWWKAQLIVACEEPNSDLQDIVLRLGGFHKEMSFLGSIGHNHGRIWLTGVA